MSLSVTRAVMRKPMMGRTIMRNASTTSEAASSGAAKAKDTASQATSKATEGLTRVSSSAGSSLSKAGSTATNLISRIGGRTGKFISFAQSLVPPTVYYSKVGLELARLVAQGQKMSPPSISTFQSYAQPIVNAVKAPGSLLNQTASKAPSAATPESVISNLRNFDSKQLAAGGVLLAEVIGFFTVGEILGRFKVIGYRSSGAHHGEH